MSLHAVIIYFVVSIASVIAQGNSTDYPPGWNGLAKSPPMGWRSWNAFGARITDQVISPSLRPLSLQDDSQWQVSQQSIKVGPNLLPC